MNADIFENVVTPDLINYSALACVKQFFFPDLLNLLGKRQKISLSIEISQKKGFGRSFTVL